MRSWRREQFRNSKDIVLYDSYYSNFDLPPFTITLREFFIAIVIMGLVGILGFKIDGKITNHLADANKKYNHAVEITSQDGLSWGMLTDEGYAFAEGDLKAVDTVSNPEIEGNWLDIYSDTERYTQHTEHYTTTDSKGHVHHHTRTYWSWDTIDTDDVHSKKVTFLGIEFPYEKFRGIDNHTYVETVDEGYHLRTTFYCTDVTQHGTVFTELKDDNISDSTKFYKDKNISETRDKYLTKGKGWQIFFRIVWILITLGSGVIFVIIDNDWLSDN